ncbi:MAG: ABC transporter permease [Bacillota bacterium]|nr:ABC transporter permease [Bacillota bacterium]
MKFTFLVKYMYNKKKYVFLLLLQTILYIYFLMNFFSFMLFKQNYIEDYNKYYPVHDGFRLVDSKSGQIGNIENTTKILFKFLDYLDHNSNVENYRFYVQHSDYNGDDLNIDYSKYYSKYQSGDVPQGIPAIEIDHIYYDIIKKYVSGPGLQDSDFHKNTDYTPIIMGKSFSKDYKVGQVLTSKDKKTKLKVVGFLKENVLILSNADSVYNSRSLEGSFILPLDRNELLSADASTAFNVLGHFSIQFNDKKIDYKAASDQITSELNALGSTFSTTNFYDVYNNFMNMVGGQLKFEIFRTTILTILSFGALCLSLLYSINTRKRDIGVLYALGARSKNIIFILCFEAVMVNLIGYLICIPLYMHFGKEVFLIFLTDYSVKNMGAAFIASLIICAISLIIPCYKIIKLNPRNLIGGFRE